MADAAPPAPEPVPSAAVLLVRNGAGGLEVFMVKRHRRVDFVPGAMVFPGGKVDEADADPRLRERCRTSAELSPETLALQVAAIREAFEESGVLLARPSGEDGLIAAERLTGLSDRHREALNAGGVGLREIVETEDLELACDLLVPFDHWITPEGVHRRYDTYFYLAPAPADHAARHDGGESVDSSWIRPAAAVAEEEAGRLTIIFPTLMQLRKLGRSDDVADALAAARQRPIVTVLPRIDRTAGEPVVRIPAEADYDVVEAPLSDLFKRGAP